ncbi:killer toxin subunits alpha beta [Colletotrichum chrysophilum]|uniref:Killer toxin subunits alpha beta n=1 Tax=Colletotrichum chrysophilum TaxID=1836956 RepID=A0AAD9ECE0_9PEZI|nr:killer toxin subunits alpha beta [Colletotrichum chrysophilum]
MADDRIEREADLLLRPLVDMDPSAPHPASGWIKTWNDYNQEEVIKVHPNDNGFLKMGYIFYKAINKAADAGKLVEPGEVNSGPTICDKVESVAKWVDDGGKTYIWTNSRSCRKGYAGDGLNVAWRQTFYQGASSGPTHMGMGVWKNIGGGGSKIVADGNKYCNMVGHRDGRVDYVWTQPTGEMTLFINRSKDTIGDTEVKGYWDPSPGIMFRPLRSMDRRDLHLQDWDGNDDCDIIYVNPETNAVEVFPNQLAVRSADLTGSNRANYLCIAPDGTVSGHLQQDSGAFVDVGQIKFAIGKDRANLRCAEVDGDRNNDMLWIEKYNGSHDSLDTGGGSSFYWKYADLDGNDHVDEHYTLESFNNKGRTSLKPSCGVADRTGDDGRVTSPNLPVQPGSDEDDDTSGGSGGDHTPYVPNPKNDNPLPTSSDASKYTTIEQLEAKAGLIDLWCGPQYTITILLQIPQDSFARYDEIMASGYYKYFKIHADYLVSNAWSALRNFMLIHSDEYFNCKITEETTCCNGDFWDAAAAEVGAPREKMSIVKLQSVGMLDSSCSIDSVYNGIEHMTASCYYRNFWFDATQVDGFNTDDVTNPKTILNKALIPWAAQLSLLLV